MPKFKKLLRTWRGKRTQREAATILGVQLSTYRNWEYGRNEPTTWAMPQIMEQITK